MRITVDGKDDTGGKMEGLLVQCLGLRSGYDLARMDRHSLDIHSPAETEHKEAYYDGTPDRGPVL